MKYLAMFIQSYHKALFVFEKFCENLNEVEEFIFKHYVDNRDANMLDTDVSCEIKCYDIKTHEKITPVCISDDNLLEKYEDIRPDHK